MLQSSSRQQCASQLGPQCRANTSMAVHLVFVAMYLIAWMCISLRGCAGGKAEKKKKKKKKADDESDSDDDEGDMFAMKKKQHTTEELEEQEEEFADFVKEKGERACSHIVK